MTVALFDTLPPVITDVPDSLYVDCFADVPVASIDSVTVTDNCDMNPFVTVSDSIYNDTLCANQLSIIRTWTAMDTCGNYSMATQFIHVFDSIPPMITDVPDSLYVDCFADVPIASIDSVTVNVWSAMLATPTTFGPVVSCVGRPPTDSAIVLCAGQKSSGFHCTVFVSSHS